MTTPEGALGRGITFIFFFCESFTLHLSFYNISVESGSLPAFLSHSTWLPHSFSLKQMSFLVKCRRRHWSTVLYAHSTMAISLKNRALSSRMLLNLFCLCGYLTDQNRSLVRIILSQHVATAPGLNRTEMSRFRSAGVEWSVYVISLS